MRSMVVLAGVLCLLLSAPRVSAEPTPTELIVARRLFQEATALEERSQWQEARLKLLEALAIKETPGLRFHLGFCNEQRGELVAALIEYDRALDVIRGGARAPDVERLLEPARSRVLGRVAQLTLRLPSDAAGAEVTLDGSKLAPAVVGRPAPVDPGWHQVRVVASENRIAHLELQLAEGEQRTVHIVLKPATAAPPAPAAAPMSEKKSAPEPAASSEKKPRPVQASTSTELDSGGLGKREAVLIGESSVALVGLGVGIGYLVVRSSARDRVKAAQEDIDAAASGDSSASCADADFPNRSSCDDLAVAIDDYDRAGLISTVGFVGAGVGAAATVLTFLIWKPEPAANSAEIAFVPAAGGGSLVFGGGF
jgi:hypothetical protein